jgi:hypothetical protein
MRTHGGLPTELGKEVALEHSGRKRLRLVDERNENVCHEDFDPLRELPPDDGEELFEDGGDKRVGGREVADEDNTFHAR